MMRDLASALALASLFACAGNTHGLTDLLPPDSGGLGLVDGGPADAGMDGGVDAGPDAGCFPLTLSGLATVDSCPGPQSASAVATISVAGAPGCGVSISLTSSTGSCTGVASHGTLDAFDGGCQGLPGYSCTSASLPGTLTCTFGASNCTIRICDGGACSP
jgi:hypothetical protein